MGGQADAEWPCEYVHVLVMNGSLIGWVGGQWVGEWYGWMDGWAGRGIDE